MTRAQQAALDGLAAGERPRIPAGTARVLSEQYGYITLGDDGWELTPRGWAHIAGHRQEEKRSAAEAKLTPADRAWAERVWSWLTVVGEPGAWDGHAFVLRRIVEHVAACRHAGIEPVLREKLTDAAAARVYDQVEAAERILHDLDEQVALATDRGVGVTVDFAADGRVPRSRRDAAEAAQQGRVINLRRYRERRPGPGAA